MTDSGTSETPRDASRDSERILILSSLQVCPVLYHKKHGL